MERMGMATPYCRAAIKLSGNGTVILKAEEMENSRLACLRILICLQ